MTTTNPTTKLTGRELKAVKVLAAGGYFHETLEANYFGHMKFKVRLLNASGQRVEGIGRVTVHKLTKLGLIDSEHSCAGTVCHYRLTPVTAWQPEVAIAFDTAMEQAS